MTTTKHTLTETRVYRAKRATTAMRQDVAPIHLCGPVPGYWTRRRFGGRWWWLPLRRLHWVAPSQGDQLQITASTDENWLWLDQNPDLERVA